ncbi:anti-proliferative BTG domain-containing protein [Cavenderia fasciculata]|uniref:Anti-proliferative BTG domain-containing protein n=1 Tax=Cavenderia fasciculata TaxID=261658 RepID=F4PNW3_CACFS|nr:anti-proliferative BTG domain-containing protein [Cavenderia fasciculata]EGG23166.1 anti-proliferative BTG domain-containing protein [Cavenderia fasciculata]|eukprot:XP_004361017.1 anti-proliferative BTG domain-containing protein [Cavenderia fasciculata]
MTPYAESGGSDSGSSSSSSSHGGGGSNSSSSKPVSIPTATNGLNNSSTAATAATTLNASGNALNLSGGTPNPSTSPPLSDIEHYLNTTYSGELPELVVAACWWADSLGKLNVTIPKDNLKRFRKELIMGLRERIRGHWYPETPDRGQGYRAVVCEETTDRLLIDAARRSDIHGDFRSFFKQNTTMWVDPGNVTYRHGKHYEKTLYPLNYYSTKEGSVVGAVSITSSGGSSNIIGGGSSSNSVNSSSSSINGIGAATSSNNNNSNIMGSSGGFSMNSFSNSLLNNVINQTPPRGNQNVTRVSSPSLSSNSAPFSPSSPLVYHLYNQSPSVSPPASPAKDLYPQNQPNNNSSNPNVYSNYRTNTPIKYPQYS